MNPRFNDDVIKGFYKEDYYNGIADYSYCDERGFEKYAFYVWNRRIKKIASYVGKGNFLDIGSAFGGFLKAASRCFCPYGIELSEFSGYYSKKIFGDSIHIGQLNDHPFQADFFSVITMIELLEHITDPVSVIKECYRLLEKKGLLVIQTANMDGMQARILKYRYGYYLPCHISYFSRENLTRLLQQEGFKKIIIFQPVEFGLLPKLLKSSYNFHSIFDYYKWLRIALYHYMSKIRYNSFSFTSSMVVYAFK